MSLKQSCYDKVKGEQQRQITFKTFKYYQCPHERKHVETPKLSVVSIGFIKVGQGTLKYEEFMY